MKNVAEVNLHANSGITLEVGGRWDGIKIGKKYIFNKYIIDNSTVKITFFWNVTQSSCISSLTLRRNILPPSSIAYCLFLAGYFLGNKTLVKYYEITWRHTPKVILFIITTVRTLKPLNVLYFLSSRIKKISPLNANQAWLVHDTTSQQHSMNKNHIGCLHGNFKIFILQLELLIFCSVWIQCDFLNNSLRIQSSPSNRWYSNPRCDPLIYIVRN